MLDKDIPPKTREKLLELLATVSYSLAEVRKILKRHIEKKKRKKSN